VNLAKFIKRVKPSYCFDWYHEKIVELIERCLEEKVDLLVSAPPGSGKTEEIAILLPLWLIAQDPKTHIISLANSDSLSRLAASNILRLVQSPDFQDIAPIELDKATEQMFNVSGNDGRPTLHSAGINGQLSGHRANFLIYDDLTKNLADAYSEAVRERTWSNFNSAAETRLLPDGRIFGIQTRWALDDVHGRLVRRALDNPNARQFIYANFAATNSGTQSYVLDTRTKKTVYLRRYESLATKKNQPYSFGPSQLEGKQADLGPTIYQALYMGNPVATENQMFPPGCWGYVDGVNVGDYALIITAWDTAARDKATNDPSCNVVVGRRHSGDFVVLDVREFKLTFDKLLPVVTERGRLLERFMRQTPLLCIEDASSGQALLDVIRSQFPQVPFIAAKAVRSKIVRAESVTPFTMAGSVSLLRGEWNAQFIADLANFPASDRDHSVDAFCHAMRAFTGTGSDFRKPQWTRVQPNEDQVIDALTDEALAGRSDYGGLPDLDDELARANPTQWMSDATYFAISRSRR